MNKPLVTIITPTIGTKHLKQCGESVDKQTYDNIQHLIVVDGKEHRKKVIDQVFHDSADILVLPYNTGHDQYNGHRIYGASTFLAKGEYLIFLDEDNWLEPNHVESLVNCLQDNKRWAYTLRKIVSPEGEYICNDDCESLGKWKSVINDNFIDLNCYIIHKSLGLQFSPYWYRRARHPDDQPEVDRIMSAKFMNMGEPDHTGEYTVNYRVASRSDSVQAEFFLKGNDIMKQKHGGYPWRKI